MIRRTVDLGFDRVVPDPGDDTRPKLDVEAIRAYSIGEMPRDWAEGLVRHAQEDEPEDDGMRVRAAHVLIDGEWVPL